MSPVRQVDVDALLEDVVGDHPGRRARAVGRLISLVDDEHPALREVMAALVPVTARRAQGATVVGLTGPPGVGKSTTTAALIAAFREKGSTVGVLAVDPSSPFSGGALLGDRIRMEDHATDPGVFIRSMASRGHLGGLSAATPQALRVLDAAGFDVVLIETVGVGQSEVEVAGLADTTTVLLAPGMGDGIQAAKAGILEIGDVFVVNKADRDGAQATARDLRHMITLGERRQAGDWRPPVVLASAHSGKGVDEFVEALAKHDGWLRSTGQLEVRRKRRASAEIEALALNRLKARLEARRGPGEDDLEGLAGRVVAGGLDPYGAADRLVDSLLEA
ncbi:methylmalonyl Co-A mutase-associated GTPase MeaB [Spongisporangium articulatum]|uniref:Methylmalonyl Co-A mutase-associated GTPase MeaB n=1 Tax=Spongisporangium articulatum TaxID=3362603 RepID=A0ABW8ATA1_9ACTN